MLALLLACVVLLGPVTADFDWNDWTPLDEYVNKDDGYYSWEQLDEYYYENITTTVYVLNMTSQKYMNESFVQHSIWWHKMYIAVPDVIRPGAENLALMLIDGGSNNFDGSYAGKDDLEAWAPAVVANGTGIISSHIDCVPNQPLYFFNDPTFQRRTEDAIIAWTWRTFIDDPNRDPNVVLRLPMTLAAKRGLDTINALVMQKRGYNVNQFYVTGASKRGWTTWSIAATDRRVKAIAPMVMSLLNFDETLMAHYRAMDGAWSFALKPYYFENLTEHVLDPSRLGLWELEDMFMYRRRLTMPKLVISATGDEFFLCQDHHHWWRQMPGPKWLMMCPNAEHALFPCYLRMAQSIQSFFIGVFEDWPFPDINWGRHIQGNSSGFVEMRATPPPDYDLDIDGNPVFRVRGLRAVTLTNNTRRDYRLQEGWPDPELQPIWWNWRNQTIEHLGLGNFRHTTDQVAGEWVGHFIEGEWEGPDGWQMFYTTEVNIMPDTFPAPPCTEDPNCKGILV